MTRMFAFFASMFVTVKVLNSYQCSLCKRFEIFFYVEITNAL